MTKPYSVQIQGLKLLAITYFSVNLTITVLSVDHIKGLDLRELFNIFLLAFGSMGLAPLAKSLSVVHYSFQHYTLMNLNVFLTLAVLNFFATLGTILSVKTISVIESVLKIKPISQGFVSMALLLGTFIAVLNVIRIPTIIYSILPLILAIGILLHENRIMLLEKVVVIFTTATVTFLVVVFSGGVVENYMMLLCMVPSVSLILLRKRYSASDHKGVPKGESTKENMDSIGINELREGDGRKSDERRYRKVYLIKLAS